MNINDLYLDVNMDTDKKTKKTRIKRPRIQNNGLVYSTTITDIENKNLKKLKK